MPIDAKGLQASYQAENLDRTRHQGTRSRPGRPHLVCRIEIDFFHDSIRFDSKLRPFFWFKRIICNNYLGVISFAPLFCFVDCIIFVIAPEVLILVIVFVLIWGPARVMLVVHCIVEVIWSWKTFRILLGLEYLIPNKPKALWLYTAKVSVWA